MIIKLGVLNRIYVKVHSVLELENDIMEVANDDKLGRRLQDAKLTVRKRALKVFKNDKLPSNAQVSKIIIRRQAPKVRILKKTEGNKK